VKGVSPPVRLFPIYFPIGNLATGFFVIFALLAGVVGVSTSLTGLRDVSEGYPASMMSAAAYAIVTWIDRWSFHPFLRFVLPIPSL
jgi:hypothetical protein